MAKIRLQKYCSEQGIASRRKAEEFIKKGWLKVNGKVVTELGTKVDPRTDVIELSAKAKQEQKKFKYILLNKPVGYVTNLPQHEERQASDLLPKGLKELNPVGRLDKDSEGLILFTNDGVVAHRLSSPKFDHEKEYIVTIDKPLSKGVLEKYQKGVVILGEQTKPVQVKQLRHRTYSFILREGKNRQIRRMLGNFGYTVRMLKRIRIVGLRLGSLAVGKYRELSDQEKNELFDLFG